MLLALRLQAPPRAPAPLLTAASASASTDGSSWVASLGGEIHGAAAGAAFYDAFTALAGSEEFARDTFARKPLLIEETPGVAESFTLADLREAVDGDFLDAGRGVPDVNAPGGWKMAPVSQPRGASFEETLLRMRRALQEARIRGVQPGQPDHLPRPRRPRKHVVQTHPTTALFRRMRSYVVGWKLVSDGPHKLCAHT